MRREGSDDGGVPVAVGGEGSGLFGSGHVDDEGFLAIGRDGGGEETETETDEKEEGHCTKIPFGHGKRSGVWG